MAVSTEEEHRAEAARGSLLEFTRQTHHAYQANWHHELLCGELQWWADTPDARLIVSMPPRHGKSQVVSRAMPAWLLGRDPDAELILTSYGASLAKDMCQDVQRIMEGRPYARTFPGTRLSRKGAGEAVRRSDAFGVVGRRGVLRAAGAGGPITGKGGRYIVVDDPHKNRAEAESPVIRGRVAKWYSSDLATRCEPGGRILICQTRWHEEDLVGTVLALQDADPNADRWRVLHLAAVAGEDGKHPADPRRPGDPLWPSRYPLSRLEAIRARSEYDWWSLYQGDPRRGASSEWPASHFDERIYFSDWPPLAIKAVAVDASKGQADGHGDFTAIVAGGRCHQGHLWAEAWLERLPPEGVAKRTIDVCEAFGPDVCAVEANLFQELFLVMMSQEAEARGVPFPGVPVVNMVDKNVRIRRLGGDFASRRVHVRATPGGRLLVNQLRQFPLASHDDGPDALEMLKRALVDLWNGRHGRKGPKRGRVG